ncbi:MAG: hypothetical protein DRO05_02040, partial [Thermoproteota archaeon]
MLRSLNKNQLLILRELSFNLDRSLTSVLIDISKTKGVPLSTLKLNAKVLRGLNLISIKEYDGRRLAELSSLGRLVLEIIDG